MTHTEIILSVLIYIIIGLITFSKQYKKSEPKFTAPEVIGFLAGLFWPIVIAWYGLKVIFFRDWV
jgi:uncharacterized membrane protein SirB2